MLAFRIPAGHFKCAVARRLRENIVNHHCKAVRKFDGESDAWWIASEPRISLQSDATDKIWLDVRQRTQGVEYWIVLASWHGPSGRNVLEDQPTFRHVRTRLIKYVKDRASGLAQRCGNLVP